MNKRTSNVNPNTNANVNRPSVIHLEGGYEIGTCAQEFNSATKNFALWKTYTERIDGHEEEFSELILKSRDLDDIIPAYAQQKAMDELDAGHLHSIAEIFDRIDQIKDEVFSNCDKPRYGFLTAEDFTDPEADLPYNPRHEI